MRRGLQVTGQGVLTVEDHPPAAESIVARLPSGEMESGTAHELAISRRAADDPQAFAPLYERYFLPVYRYCTRRLTDEEAADATAHIFAKALRALPGYVRREQRGGSFRSWLFAIAHNVVVDTYRARRAEVSLDQPHTLAGDPSVGPEPTVLRNEARRQLHAALATLPERQRAVIELRLAGLRHAEIADALDLSATAVRSAQYRAFTSLKPLLDSDLGNDFDAYTEGGD